IHALDATDAIHAQRTASLDLADDARAVLRARVATLGLDASHHDFRVTSEHVGTDGLHHVRMQHYADGVRVWGADVVAHADASRFTGIGGNVAAIEGLDVTPSISAGAATLAAKGDYAREASRLTAAPLAYSGESQELVILPEAEGDARLAWHVVFHT